MKLFKVKDTRHLHGGIKTLLIKAETAADAIKMAIKKIADWDNMEILYELEPEYSMKVKSLQVEEITLDGKAEILLVDC